MSLTSCSSGPFLTVQLSWVSLHGQYFQHLCFNIVACVCVSFKQLVLKYFPFVDKQDRVSTVHDFSDLCILLFLILKNASGPLFNLLFGFHASKHL